MTFGGGVGNSGGARRFAIETVIRQGLAITWHHLFRLVAIAVAVAIPIALLTALAQVVLSSGVRATPTGSAIDFSSNASAVLFLVVAVVLGLLTYLLTQAAVVFAALQVLRGGPVAIGAALGRALSALPRLLAAGLLLYVGGGVFIGVIGFLLVQLFGGASAGGELAPPAKSALAVFSLVVMVLAFWLLRILKRREV